MFASLLKGRKTYVAALALVGFAAAKFFGVPVPEEVWIALNALGLAGLRAALDA